MVGVSLLDTDPPAPKKIILNLSKLTVSGEKSCKTRNNGNFSPWNSQMLLVFQQK